MKKLNQIVWAAIGISAVALLLWRAFSPALPQLEKPPSNTGEVTNKEAELRVLTPEPLRGPTKNGGSLTRSGVIQWTNTFRSNEGQAPLKENITLNASAALKAQDMFDKQYFAHTAPTGEGVSDLARSLGYDYILIGENLALGNFANDKELVEAWMASPGHRENILYASYTEIGVAVMRGTFEGRSTWIAVQHFGKPKSACPSLDESLRMQIENNQKQIAILQTDLDALRQEIENTESKRGNAYNQKVKEYNALVDKYNALNQETKKLVNAYNQQVKKFNECAGV